MPSLFFMAFNVAAASRDELPAAEDAAGLSEHARYDPFQRLQFDEPAGEVGNILGMVLQRREDGGKNGIDIVKSPTADVSVITPASQGVAVKSHEAAFTLND
jgi:hypothetical protein